MSQQPAPQGQWTISEPLSIIMDHLRWISALLVVAGHIRQIYFVDYGEVENQSFGWAIFYSATRISHQAVLVFFLVSGAVIAGRFAYQSGWAGFNPVSFAIARLSRLWLVLFPVLAACTLLLMFTPALYLPETCSLEPLTVLGNFIFLQGVFSDVICNNIPLWSLANEFWYYTITGLMVYAATANEVMSRTIALTLLLAAVVSIGLKDQWSEKNVLAYYPIWLLGAVVFVQRLPSPPMLVGTFAFLAALFAARMPSLPVPFYIRDILFAAGTFLFLLAARGLGAQTVFAETMRRTKPIARALAGQSYSLYLVHYPISIMFIGIIGDDYSSAQQQPSIQRLALMILIMVLSYVTAQACYLLFESNTNAARKAVMGCVTGTLERRVVKP